MSTLKDEEINRIREQMSLFGLPVNVNDNIVKKTRQRWLNNSFNVGNNSDYGTFKDSLRAPVHRWFKYPAGYSYRLVEEKIKQYNLKNVHWVLDPFVGCGTTSVECKRHSVNSYGIEAHPFVGWIAQRKLNWDLQLELITKGYVEIINNVFEKFRFIVPNALPDLVRKCYSDENLKRLIAIRDTIDSLDMNNEIAD